MNVPPFFELTPSGRKDIDDCLRFISKQPWGRPDDRERDIILALEKILQAPLRHAVKVRRPATGNELRCYSVAQFVIVYVYTKPNEMWPFGKVSIRAVRHRRVQDVFLGVKEPSVLYQVVGRAA